MSKTGEGILRAIGFWRDPEIGDHRFRHPIAFVEPDWDLAERKLVAQYLRSGVRVMSYLGWSWCRFRCGAEDSEMGDSEFADGVWLWPGGQTHYVLEHSVRLPGEFVQRALPGSERPAHVRFEDSDDVPDRDLDFWVAWCNEHADPATGYRELEESERRAVVEGRRVEEPKLVAEFGTGTEECSAPGCTRPVLSGRDRCAWHVAGGDS